MRRNIDLFEYHRAGVRVRSGGFGVPSRSSSRRIAGGDLNTVEIGNEPVVVLHTQGEGQEIIRISTWKGDA